MAFVSATVVGWEVLRECTFRGMTFVCGAGERGMVAGEGAEFDGTGGIWFGVNFLVWFCCVCFVVFIGIEEGIDEG